jgi:cell wall-associated NlpC family hydrolase
MTTARTTAAPRPSLLRRAAAVVAVAAGLALTPLPAQAHMAAPPPTAAPPGTVAAPSTAAQIAVDTAMSELGRPYVWGAAGPYSFDCSGLTEYAYARAGIYLPHSSLMQSTLGRPVAYSDLRPGDLIFFYSPVGHVGMYLGNGLMIHSPTPGDVVKVTPLAYMYGYNTARRFG